MQRNVLRGITLKIGQTLFFTLMYTTVKLAGAVPVSQVMFFRSLFALVPVIIFTYFTSDLATMVRTKRPIYHVFRSLVGGFTMSANFGAVQMLPLATATAFGFLSPVFVVILAIPMLKEKVGPWRWGAVIVGFLGVLLMLEPQGGLGNVLSWHFLTSSRTGVGISCALTYAFGSAIVAILIRQMSKTERSEAIVFYFMLWAAVAGAIASIWYHVPLSGMQIFWLVVSGLIGGCGQIFLTYCYRYAEPSALAPLEYSTMIWAVALGVLLFDEIPEPLVLLGAAIVIAAGMVIVWRERKHKITRPASTPLDAGE